MVSPRINVKRDSDVSEYYAAKLRYTTMYATERLLMIHARYEVICCRLHDISAYIYDFIALYEDYTNASTTVI